MTPGSVSAGRASTERGVKNVSIVMTTGHTVELQWLEHLWNHENMFETGPANEC